MKNWKRVLLIIMIIIVSGVIGITANNIYHNWKFQKLYQSILVNDQDILFLGRPTCGFCNLLKPILEETASKYDIEYRYINTDSLTKKELKKLLEKLEIRSSTFSTPRIIITENDSIIDSYIGYMDDISLFKFFQKNHLISELEEFENPYPNIQRLSSDDYFKILENQENVNVLVGRIGDPDTNAVLKKANETKDPLKFLSLSVFQKEEDYNRFIASIKSMKENALLPLLLEIKNGNVISMIESVDEKKYKNKN